MSLGNSSRANTSTSNLTQDQTISSVDNRVSEAGAAVGGNVNTGPGDINGSLSISTTDQGAILAAKDIVLESIKSLDTQNKAVQSTTSDSIKGAYDLSNKARQSAQTENTNNFLKYGAMVAIAIAIVWGVIATKKRG